MANSFSALDPHSVPSGRDDDNLIALGSTLRTVLKPLASLKFTVALFAMAIFIVLAGTFAQVHDDIWVVIDKYFRVNPNEFVLTDFPWIDLKVWFVKIDAQVFFPPSFFPGKPQVPGWIVFPKGWLIGMLMGVNLVAAHLLRFKVQARGTRLYSGLGVIALGLLATFLVVTSGSNQEGFQESLWSKNWDTLWTGIELGVGALLIAAVVGCATLSNRRNSQRLLLGGAAVALAGALVYMLTQGSQGRFSDSSMRILWQLIKAEFAAITLLIGCWIAFKKRAGVVLLHGGIGLMMASEVLVGTQAVETQMSLFEGETTNYVHDIRSVELAVVDHEPADHDNVTVVPGALLQRSAEASGFARRNPQRAFAV